MNHSQHFPRAPRWWRQRRAAAAAAVFALTITAAPWALQESALAADASVSVVIDGDDVAAENINGLTFKGFGVLSANSTSAVLMDYKAQNPEAYSQLLKTLFGGSNPIMEHVKIEMGNDRNTSTGPNPATMRTLDEEANPARDPGFQLAADAKKINPDLKVSILRWREPYFASGTSGRVEATYTWFKNTILAAYREYGYMIDYLNPGRNEESPTWTWTVNFVNWIRNDTTGYVSEDPELAGWSSAQEQELFQKIKIIIDDNSGLPTFGTTMRNSTTYMEAVDVIGYHYTTNDDSAGNFKWMADTADKEVWNSEAQATFSNSAFRPNNNVADPTVVGTGIGGTNSALEMANTIVKGYVNSRRTHFIYQPAIGSFYEGGQYSHKELVSARDPWSGWIHYDAGLLMLEHFTDFAVTGWENETNTAGIWRAVTAASASSATGTNPIVGRGGGPNHITLAAPDKSAFSTVVVNDSEYTNTYTFTVQDMEIEPDASLEIWETRAASTGEVFNTNYKKHIGDVAPSDDGTYTVVVKPYSIVTVTSLDRSSDPEVLEPLPVEGERTVLDIEANGDGVLWADDFEYGDKTVPVYDSKGDVTAATESFIDSRGGPTGADALYTWDRNGAFEAYLEPGGDNYVLRQQVDQTAFGGLGSAWNSGDPITGIGDFRWVNYKASVDVRFDRDTTSNYAAIGVRSTGGDNSQALASTPYVLRLSRAGTWSLQRFGSTVSSGAISVETGTWHNLAVQAAGNQITAYIDGEQVAAYTDASPVLSGRVDLASGFYWTSFDNLKIEKLDTYAAYYDERLDNMEMTDLADPPNTKLVYGGSWLHTNGQSMYTYGRSVSTSQATGASVSYTFTGTGFDIMANNSSSATLELTIDGNKVSVSEKNWPTSAYWRTSYSLRGLPFGEHTVKLTVTAGTLVVDSFDTIAGPVADPAAIDLSPIVEALEATSAVTRTERYTDEDWAAYLAVRADALAAVADPEAYGLDAEGPAEIVARLASVQAAAGSLEGNWSLPTPYLATWKGQTPALPATLTATNVDNGATEEFEITWNLAEVSFDTAWSTVRVTGVYRNLETTATVEVVPEGLLYFVDGNGVASGLGVDGSALGYTSPAYLAIAELVSQSGRTLLNDVADQVYDAADGWGHQGYTPSGTAGSIAYKGVATGAYSKVTTTGMYAGQNSTGALVTYTFTLPAGSYALAFTSYSWWSGSARTTEAYIDYGSTTSATPLATFSLTSSSNVAGYSNTFPVTMAEEGAVTLRLRATNNQAPMFSWAGVYEVIPTGVAISPQTASVIQGQTADFTGTVTLSTGATNNEVAWEVSGGTSNDTTINSDGVLSVGADEAPGTVLTVTATSDADPTKTASATVTVRAAPPALGKPKLTGSPAVGQTLTLNYTLTPEETPVAIRWYRVGCGEGCPKLISAANDQTTYTLTTAELTAGAIQVKVSAFDEEGVAAVVKYSDTVTVTQEAPATAPKVKTATLTNDDGTLSLAYVTDPSNYPAEDVTIRWYNGTSTVKDGSTSISGMTHVPTTSGVYKVKLTLVGSTVARYSNGVDITM
ncbi:MAG: hypothetical protein LBD97_04685 [Bifidobacteriaceae bacterium]|jgi:hypothetical protein|nr:hypothetical protein [Bifidobacteriaceae bacterium]